MKNYIVIGAGILGASTAYHLAKSGAKVTVVDRHDKGQATDAAAGIICPWLSQRRNKAWYSLAKSGAAYYEELIGRLEEDGETETGYKRVGAISLHTDESKLIKMEERAVARREDAPEIGEVRLMKQDETSSAFPPLAKEFSAVSVSGAARVNGRALRQSLVRAAKKHGATFIHGSAEIEHENAAVTGVRVGNEHYAAENVMITAGAWADYLLEPLGIELQLSSQKAQIVHLQIENSQTDDWPVVMPPNDQYILAFDDGQVVIGATHEDHENFDLRVTAGGLHEVFHKALSVAPGLADSTFVETRVGFRPFTPNFLPIIGRVPGWEGLLLANGLGASGLTVGPFLGAQLAKLALYEPVEIDLALYDVSGAIAD
ncbi:FAD-binding oxidoreductase [Paenisporosarcina quisquiliarum]|uniref:FAD-binding oxidoreductase n=1 Tax=Paenisporosarcina quisquiliarum TaxID=365346 RepID=A0A9X3LH14_9BACL|nr:FAD-binding oxidoreductase [Paenisporosarcina quisquiliarum]MCZ8537848.1 FAD-binding oxidoreductase [Paenisporosarcina quisquiliarum]